MFPPGASPPKDYVIGSTDLVASGGTPRVRAFVYLDSADAASR